MGMKGSIDHHPKRKQIDSAIIKGIKSNRLIAAQYGLSQAAIQRYVSGKLRPKIATALVRKELKEGNDLLQELNEYIVIAKKVLKAAEEYLQHPDDPDKLFLGPRDNEIEINYTVYKGSKRFKKTALLSDLLKEVQAHGTDIEKGKSLYINNMKMTFQDPRVTILQAANTLTKQIDQWAKIHGDIGEVAFNLSIQPAFQVLIQVILETTKGHPTIRREIVAAIKSIKPTD